MMVNEESFYALGIDPSEQCNDLMDSIGKTGYLTREKGKMVRS